MATRQGREVVRSLQTLFNLGTFRELTDGQLLERFATGPGEAAELAFAALVERHGAMVLRVCRARLGHSHDSQDAFQATFLILIQKARGLWVRDSLGPWLHQVAVRTASCARTSSMRRRRLEQRLIDRIEAFQESSVDPWEHILHEEINRLPERYRVPIILCDLQGHTNDEAARRMGRPVGTVKSWRSRGRDTLRSRLIRRGITPAVGFVIAAKVSDAAAVGCAAEMAAGRVSASVHALVQGVLTTMVFSKMRVAGVAVAAMLAVTAGLGVVSRGNAQSPKHEPVSEQKSLPRTPKKEAEEDWPMTLRVAIVIAMDNSPIIRVPMAADAMKRGGEVVVARVGDESEPYRFKSELMAMVRSVEQTYWALKMGMIEHAAAETAVRLAEEAQKREQGKPDAGGDSNQAKVQKQLEQFRVDLSKKTEDLVTLESQLRRILNLPPADGRRIVPTTAPLAARVKPDWEKCQAAMMENQPDILRSRTLAPDQRERFHQQIVKQCTHSLARFFLSIDGNFDHFQSASMSCDADRQRLEASKLLYASDDLAVDRYFDAISEWTASVSEEAKYQGQYNVAIVALEEAKGTLLDFHKIIVAQKAKPAFGPAALVDRQAKQASVEPQAADAPLPIATEPPIQSPKSEAAGKTISFQMSIGVGAKPIEIRGSFTVSPATSK